MATYLFVWEIGAGLGHLAHLRPLIYELRKRGHQVVAAVPNVAEAQNLLPDIDCMAGPMKRAAGDDLILEASTYAEMLHNVGFADRNELLTLVQAWRQLFDRVKPELVVLDYSPLALTALQGYRTRGVQLGTGFYSPPDVSPLPDLCPWENNYPDRLQLTEKRVLNTLNSCLESLGHSPLPRVTSLFDCLADNLLATFAELDHYGERPGVTYWGTWSSILGGPIEWPSTQGRKIFAYLRPSNYLPFIVSKMKSLNEPVVLYLGGSQADLAKRYTSKNVNCYCDPVDMSQLTAECDVAILYASHATTAELLLAGKPILAIPTHVEQYITARNIEKLAAGISAPQRDESAFEEGLQSILADERYRQGATRFARRYADFDPQVQINRVVSRLELLAQDNN